MAKRDTNTLSKRSKWLRYTLEILLIIAVFFALKTWLQRDMMTGFAPDFSGVTQDGEHITLAQLERPVLVYFWASWCGVCRFAQNGIEAVAQDWPVLTVAMHSGDAAQVKQYLQAHQLTFSALVDAHGQLADLYGVSAVPASFIIDADDQIRYRERGYTSAWGLRFRLWLAQTF